MTSRSSACTQRLSSCTLTWRPRSRFGSSPRSQPDRLAFLATFQRGWTFSASIPFFYPSDSPVLNTQPSRAHLFFLDMSPRLIGWLVLLFGLLAGLPSVVQAQNTAPELGLGGGA